MCTFLRVDILGVFRPLPCTMWSPPKSIGPLASASLQSLTFLLRVTTLSSWFSCQVAVLNVYVASSAIASTKLLFCWPRRRHIFLHFDCLDLTNTQSGVEIFADDCRVLLVTIVFCTLVFFFFNEPVKILRAREVSACQNEFLVLISDHGQLLTCSVLTVFLFHLQRSRIPTACFFLPLPEPVHMRPSSNSDISLVSFLHVPHKRKPCHLLPFVFIKTSSILSWLSYDVAFFCFTSNVKSFYFSFLLLPRSSSLLLLSFSLPPGSWSRLWLWSCSSWSFFSHWLHGVCTCCKMLKTSTVSLLLPCPRISYI